MAVILIGWIFWEQEVKYSLPTSIPDHFKDVELGQAIDLSFYHLLPGKIAMLHFFNPHCPCSRFNMMEFERLSMKYRDQADVYVILQSSDESDVEKFRSKYKLNLPVLLDKNGEISDRCGIYSTPQSVLLDRESRLYFKGNYNAARYCSRKETSFAEMAMDHLLQDETLPLWITTELTLPYGCALPSDESYPPFEIARFFN
ncbi:MAG TPA: TlpA disulfide reductase family protein [Chryseolinea sp.]|nr:TlpA disulfide reductase family protein [Chryseolinea sp.]